MSRSQSRLATDPSSPADDAIARNERLLLERTRLCLRFILAGVLVVFVGWIVMHPGELPLVSVVHAINLLVVGAWLGRQSGVMTSTDLGLALLLLVLVAAQFGLGYSDSRSASAIHIPNGVLVTGLTFAVISRAFTRRGSF